jgi:hypothetical protein
MSQVFCRDLIFFIRDRTFVGKSKFQIYFDSIRFMLKVFFDYTKENSNFISTNYELKLILSKFTFKKHKKLFLFFSRSLNCVYAYNDDGDDFLN